MTRSWSRTRSRVRRSGAGTARTGDGGLRAGYGSGEGALPFGTRDLLCPPRVIDVVHVFRVRLVPKSEHDMWESFLNYPLGTVRTLTTLSLGMSTLASTHPLRRRRRRGARCVLEKAPSVGR